MAAPRFITFEGLDGSGKSTHLAWVAEELARAGVLRDALAGDAVGPHVEVFEIGKRAEFLQCLIVCMGLRETAER